MYPGDNRTAPEIVSSPSFLPFSSVIPYLSPVVSTAPSRSKAYQIRKLEIQVISGLLGFLTLIAIVASGLSGFITSAWASVIPFPYGVLFAVFVSIGGILFAIRFPFLVYAGVVLEREFGLMRQPVLSWILDLAKGITLGSLFGGMVIAALYWCITTFGDVWWLPLSSILFLMHLMMSIIGPRIILPLFYTLTPLTDAMLRERIERICAMAGVRAHGIFVIGFGEKTKKANAALTGLGPSKRIVLSDTLIENLRDDEIEAVFAHEVGHQKLRHIWLGIATGAISSFVSLFLVSKVYGIFTTLAGTYPANIAMLPLLGALIGAVSFLFGPLRLWLSRWQEYAADRFAARLLGTVEPLAHALEKLSRINLADPDPHPMLEALTFSHPSLARRLARLRTIV